MYASMTYAALHFFFALGFTMPHKPHLHAVGPIGLHMSAIYKYVIYTSY